MHHTKLLLKSCMLFICFKREIVNDMESKSQPHDIGYFVDRVLTTADKKLVSCI